MFAPHHESQLALLGRVTNAREKIAKAARLRDGLANKAEAAAAEEATAWRAHEVYVKSLSDTEEPDGKSLCRVSVATDTAQVLRLDASSIYALADEAYWTLRWVSDVGGPSNPFIQDEYLFQAQNDALRVRDAAEEILKKLAPSRHELINSPKRALTCNLIPSRQTASDEDPLLRH